MFVFNFKNTPILLYYLSNFVGDIHHLIMLINYYLINHDIRYCSIPYWVHYFINIVFVHID